MATSRPSKRPAAAASSSQPPSKKLKPNTKATATSNDGHNKPKNAKQTNQRSMVKGSSQPTQLSHAESSRKKSHYTRSTVSPKQALTRSSGYRIVSNSANTEKNLRTGKQHGVETHQTPQIDDSDSPLSEVDSMEFVDLEGDDEAEMHEKDTQEQNQLQQDEERIEQEEEEEEEEEWGQKDQTDSRHQVASKAISAKQNVKETSLNPKKNNQTRSNKKIAIQKADTHPATEQSKAPAPAPAPAPVPVTVKKSLNTAKARARDTKVQAAVKDKNVALEYWLDYFDESELNDVLAGKAEHSKKTKMALQIVMMNNEQIADENRARERVVHGILPSQDPNTLLLETDPSGSRFASLLESGDRSFSQRPAIITKTARNGSRYFLDNRPISSEIDGVVLNKWSRRFATIFEEPPKHVEQMSLHRLITFLEIRGVEFDKDDKMTALQELVRKYATQGWNQTHNYSLDTRSLESHGIKADGWISLLQYELSNFRLKFPEAFDVLTNALHNKGQKAQLQDHTQAGKSVTTDTAKQTGSSEKSTQAITNLIDLPSSGLTHVMEEQPTSSKNTKTHDINTPSDTLRRNDGDDAASRAFAHVHEENKPENQRLQTSTAHHKTPHTQATFNGSNTNTGERIAEAYEDARELQGKSPENVKENSGVADQEGGADDDDGLYDED